MSSLTYEKSNQLSSMTKDEKMVTAILAGLFSLRMLGLFMLLPVLALYTQHYVGADSKWIGIALGIYGLTQACFQIPLGMLSDRIGRKPVILVGLMLLGAGSLVASSATTIEALIAGRALQGAGAIGSTLLAFAADSTREGVRSRAMAVIGITIGLSFGLAMVIGPLLENAFGLKGIFNFTFVVALIGIGLLYGVLPKEHPMQVPTAKGSRLKKFYNILINRNLACLNLSILCLHALFSSAFLVIPHLIVNILPELATQSWKLYVPVLIGALFIMMPFVRRADKAQNLKRVALSAIIGLALGISILMSMHSKIGVCLGLVLFFSAFNILESLLPAFVSVLAPQAHRGSALGVYSTAQFFGIFLGGAVGGSIQQAFGLLALSLWCMILVLLFIGAIGYVKRY